MLSSFMVAVSLSAALKYTVVWDTSTCPWLPSCSAPNQDTPWTEVVIRGNKRNSVVSTSSFSLNLSKHDAAPSGHDLQVLPSDVHEHPVVSCPHRAQTTLPTDTAAFPSLVNTEAFPPLVASSNWEPVDRSMEPRPPTTRPLTSSAQHGILHEAVLRHS